LSREEPLLDAIKLARIKLQGTRRTGESRQRLLGLGGGAFGRGNRAIEHSLSAVGGAGQAAQGSGQRRQCPTLAVDLANRLADGLAQPLGVLQ
jgi:hypothetical protein